jgi:hypothetical protein
MDHRAVVMPLTSSSQQFVAAPVSGAAISAALRWTADPAVWCASAVKTESHCHMDLLGSESAQSVQGLDSRLRAVRACARVACVHRMSTGILSRKPGHVGAVCTSSAAEDAQVLATQAAVVFAEAHRCLPLPIPSCMTGRTCAASVSGTRMRGCASDHHRASPRRTPDR